jgi:hypothetical protein
MTLIDEIKEELKSYLVGASSRSDLEAWLASIDWSASANLSSEAKAILGELELLSTEIAEGLRQETELKAAARSWLANSGALPDWVAEGMPARASDMAPLERITAQAAFART